MSKVKQVIKMMGYNTLYGIKMVLSIMPTIIMVLTPYCCMAAALYGYCERGGLYFGGEYLLPIIMYIVYALFVNVNKVLECEKIGDCPVARKRFTRRDTNGRVIFNSNDIYEMVEYLAEVEQYCEKYGKYRR